MRLPQHLILAACTWNGWPCLATGFPEGIATQLGQSVDIKVFLLQKNDAWSHVLETHTAYYSYSIPWLCQCAIRQLFHGADLSAENCRRAAAFIRVRGWHWRKDDVSVFGCKTSTRFLKIEIHLASVRLSYRRQSSWNSVDCWWQFDSKPLMLIASAVVQSTLQTVQSETDAELAAEKVEDWGSKIGFVAQVRYDYCGQISGRVASCCARSNYLWAVAVWGEESSSLQWDLGSSFMSSSSHWFGWENFQTAQKKWREASGSF